jgi:hypothetical protein
VTWEHLRRDFNLLFKHLDTDESGVVDAEELRKLLFGHYMKHLTEMGAGKSDGHAGEKGAAGPPDSKREGSSGGPGVPEVHVAYDELTNFDAVIHEIQDSVRRLEAATQQASFLCVSLYQAEHVTRLCRVLRLRRGHALLVGSSGTGKRSVARLSAFMCGVQLFEFDPDTAYSDGAAAKRNKTPGNSANAEMVRRSSSAGSAEGSTAGGDSDSDFLPDWSDDMASQIQFQRWRVFLRNVIVQIGKGHERKGVVLVQSCDLDADMLEDLNCILNGVEIPALFTHAQQVGVIPHPRMATHVKAHASACVFKVKCTSSCLHLYGFHVCIQLTGM